MKRKIIIITLSVMSYLVVAGNSPAPQSFYEGTYTGRTGEKLWVENFSGIFWNVSGENSTKSEKGWIYHQFHGWTWVEEDDLNNLWLHTEEIGWIWTSWPGLYPWLFSPSKGWLYYIENSGNPRLFYFEDVKTWETVFLPYEVKDYFTYEQSPKLQEEVMPELPGGLQSVSPSSYEAHDGEKGWSEYEFVVGMDGQVRDIVSTFAYNMPTERRDEVVAAGIQALKNSEFVPGIRDGAAVELHYSHRYYFIFLE